MKQRKLGQDGPNVSELALGCMGMSAIYQAADQKECEVTLRTAVEGGVTLFDTADMYGDGKNEELLARVLKPFRGRVLLSTKFGNLRKSDGTRTVNGRPDYVRQACDASLARLKTDALDLYFLHRVDPDVPIEDTVGAMSELVVAGKVRYIGLSEASPSTLRRAHAIHPISALQTEYSLFSREPAEENLKTARELGVGFIAYSPLGRGILSGRFRTKTDFGQGDFRPNMPRFQGSNLERNVSLVDALEKLAQTKDCSVPQLALAWLLSRGDDIVPLFGTANSERLSHNLASADVQLTEDELQKIETIVPRSAVAGDRYHASGMSAVNL
ncbi:aldo/keto reductase [Caballeronia sp. 15711]|uniref:aldo/keto reductase n=1 Tax=Caballeronia sp. 15711 TaxID=3391029 RepID=UPI0039E3FC95